MRFDSSRRGSRSLSNRRHSRQIRRRTRGLRGTRAFGGNARRGHSRWSTLRASPITGRERPQRRGRLSVVNPPSKSDHMVSRSSPRPHVSVVNPPSKSDSRRPSVVNLPRLRASPIQSSVLADMNFSSRWSTLRSEQVRSPGQVGSGSSPVASLGGRPSEQVRSHHNSQHAPNTEPSQRFLLSRWSTLRASPITSCSAHGHRRNPDLSVVNPPSKSDHPRERRRVERSRLSRWSTLRASPITSS